MGLEVYNSNELGFVATGVTYMEYTTSLAGGRGTSFGCVAQTFLELGPIEACLVTPSHWESQYKKLHLLEH
jgi:hypothetical protein